MNTNRPSTAEGRPPTAAWQSLPWPPTDPAVRASLLAALDDGTWGQYRGPREESLRQRLLEMHGGRQVRLCSSGTIAVELALRGLEVGEGSEVILGGYDFPGNFYAVEKTGAFPVLVDVDPRTGCLNPDGLESAASERTRVVLVSHLHSGLAPMRAVIGWCHARGIAVVEDACQAPGAMVDGRLAGTWGDVSVLSFGGSKLLSAGRGGAILCHHDDVMQRIRVFAERGNDAYPLSELQATVLLPQLDQLAARNERRVANVQRLREVLRELAWLVDVGDEVNDVSRPSFYKVAWCLDDEHPQAPLRAELLAVWQRWNLPLGVGFAGFARCSSRRCRQAVELVGSRRLASQTILLHHPVLLQPSATIEQMGQAMLRHSLEL